MKIKGFTLVEMLLAMALTGVVVSLAWFVFAHFQQMGSGLKSRSERATELSLLHFALLQDCRQAQAYRLEGAKLLLSAGGEAPFVRYEWNDRAVFRQAISLSVFNLEGIQWEGGTDARFFLVDSLHQRRLPYKLRQRAWARRPQSPSLSPTF